MVERIKLVKKDPILKISSEWEIYEERHGRGMSMSLHGRRQVGPVWLLKSVWYPGPYDGLAGYSTEIKEQVSVWFCHQDEEPPSSELPQGALGWIGLEAEDGHLYHWYANFGDNEEAAEKWATTKKCAIKFTANLNSKE